MRSAIRDVAAGGVLLVVAGLYYWQTRQIQQSSLSDDVGPEGLPLVLAAALALVAAAIAVKGVVLALRARALPVAGAPVDDEDAPASLPRALGFLAIGVGYILLAPYTGFAIGIALLVATVALYEGIRPDWRLAAVAVGAGLFFWVVFVKFLGTEQPVGLLF
ncbi:tripartite tricarboxylate transporter TctB family protein [Alsobacter sp. R-9]